MQMPRSWLPTAFTWQVGAPGSFPKGLAQAQLLHKAQPRHPDPDPEALVQAGKSEARKMPRTHMQRKGLYKSVPFS